MMQCEICGSNVTEIIELTSYRLRMYEKKWNYVRCLACGCLRIEKVPDNIGKLYDSSYESFAQEYSHTIKDRLFIQKRKYEISGKLGVGKIINSIYPYGDYAFLRKLEKGKDVLDIGCGYGELLNLIKECYPNHTGALHGIDPYLEKDRLYQNGVKLYRVSVKDYYPEHNYDMIMLNHSFEHMLDEDEVLVHTNRLLKQEGILSIEIPIINRYVWERFGNRIGELDPPFHFFIHTYASMHILLKRNGYEIVNFKSTLSPEVGRFIEKEKNAFAIGKIMERNRVNILNEGNIARFICRKVKR